MKFKNLSCKEFQNQYFNNTTEDYVIPVVENDFGHYHFENFHYFSPDNTNTDYENILIAYDDNNPFLVYGVILYGWYGYGEKYQGISYIDVNSEYRNKGIATKLIQEFNKYVSHSTLYVSYLSRDGQKCNIGNLFKKYVTNTSVVIEE